MNVIEELRSRLLPIDYSKNDVLDQISLTEDDLKTEANVDKLVLDLDAKELRKISFITAANIYGLIKNSKKPLQAFDLLLVSLLKENLQLSELTEEIEEFFLNLAEKHPKKLDAIRLFLASLRETFLYYYEKQN